MQHSHAAEDTRLLLVGEGDVWASYVIFDHPDPACAGGHWLSRLRLKQVRAAHSIKLVGTLAPTDEAPGIGLNGTGGVPLSSTRNAGLIARGGRIAFVGRSGARALD